MTKELWINLPVKDIKRSVSFFTKLGFEFKTGRETPVSACMIMGTKKTAVMLFKEDTFRGFTQHPVTDTSASCEVLISIDAESRSEVDDLAAKAAAAGGTVFGKPGESQGWLYGCGFTDLDGHRWNVLYMDMAKMPK